MKIGIFLGYDGRSGQVDRIADGWVNNGNIIFKEGDERVDLIYANDPGYYDQAIELKNKYIQAKLILNVLDIPKKYYPNLNLQDLKNKLEKADIITTISLFSQDQIKSYLNLNSVIIYNPIKNVSFKNYQRDIDFIYIGRLYEENKRFNLGLEALSKLGINKNQFFVAGPDNPGSNLNYLGIVDDFTLDMLYNRSHFLICPTEYGVLGLPPIEALICGCIPILCSDNPAVKEFGLEDFAFSPDPDKIAEGISKINKEVLENKIKNISENLFNKLNKNKIAKNIETLL